MAFTGGRDTAGETLYDKFSKHMQINMQMMTKTAKIRHKETAQ